MYSNLNIDCFLRAGSHFFCANFCSVLLLVIVVSHLFWPFLCVCDIFTYTFLCVAFSFMCAFFIISSHHFVALAVVTTVNMSFSRQYWLLYNLAEKENSGGCVFQALCLHDVCVLVLLSAHVQSETSMNCSVLLFLGEALDSSSMIWPWYCIVMSSWLMGALVAFELQRCTQNVQPVSW